MLQQQCLIGLSTRACERLNRLAECQKMLRSCVTTPEDDTKWSCLDESQPFARLNQRKRFWRKYGHAIALVPFVVVLFVLLRFFGNSTSSLFTVPIYVSLAWAAFVAIYSLTLIVRVLSIRCPRCGWRFGGGDQCGSCSFPRHSESVSV